MAKRDVLKKLSDLIWNETIFKEDLESTWKNIIDKFDLSQNNWFNRMYKMKDIWIPTYVIECSSFGLMTTSRS